MASETKLLTHTFFSILLILVSDIDETSGAYVHHFKKFFHLR